MGRPHGNVNERAKSACPYSVWTSVHHTHQSMSLGAFSSKLPCTIRTRQDLLGCLSFSKGTLLG